MNICMTINSKYVRYTYVTLLSLYENNKSGIRLFIIHDDLTDQDKLVLNNQAEKYGNTVEFIDCDMKILNEMPVFRGDKKDRYPISIFSRLLIPKYLPKDVDRLILIDSDLIVNQSLDELYNLDMQGNYFAAAANMCGNGIIPRTHRHWYAEGRTMWLHYNIGVLLWDLQKIRNDYPEDYLFKLAWKWKNVEVDSFDEELLNIEFGEKGILRISEKRWNYIASWVLRRSNTTYWKYTSLDDLKENCAVVHFAGFAPWRGNYIGEAYDLWWEWAKKTPYYVEFIDEIQQEYKNKLTKANDDTANLNNLLNIMQCIILFDGRKRLCDYLKNNGISQIYVYGAGRIGECIKHLLRDSGIEIIAYIDRSRKGTWCDIPIIAPDDLLNHENDGFILVSNGYFIGDITGYLRKTGMKWITIDSLLF